MGRPQIIPYGDEGTLINGKRQEYLQPDDQPLPMKGPPDIPKLNKRPRIRGKHHRKIIKYEKIILRLHQNNARTCTKNELKSRHKGADKTKRIK